MSRLYAHVNTAKTIINLYKGEMPFASFLKSFFSKEKKYGSRDRRTISSICYNYFRMGCAIELGKIDDRLLAGSFLCLQEPNELLQTQKPEWNENVLLPLQQKISISGIAVEKIFPFNDELSGEIDATLFNTSFLIQPKLFARIRPGKQQMVLQKLTAAQIDFETINDSCLAFANGTKLEETLHINNDVVIQDLNSQRVGELMLATKTDHPVIWDCCAASGGKSIMASDLFVGCRLTVSDVRQSIIQNLKARFKDAEMVNYTSFVADITQQNSVRHFLKNSSFDLVICDAPCSGSGTWSRTPEQLLHFTTPEIERYANLQKSIVANTIEFTRKGGFFLYITCSVFRQENEDVVAFIQQNSNLRLIKSELFKGYEVQADTMFAALFQG